MHAVVILVELRNPETHLWEYFEYDNYTSSNNSSDIQRKINRKLKICNCNLFECCGSYFYELFAAIKQKHSSPTLFKGLPNDASKKIVFSHKIWLEDIGIGYDASYLYLEDLIAFNYNLPIQKKTGWEEISGVHCTKAWSRVLKSGYEIIPTYRKVLGEKFFIDLDFLKTIGKPREVRIVYWFWDNSNEDPDINEILNDWTC